MIHSNDTEKRLDAAPLDPYHGNILDDRAYTQAKEYLR